MLNIISGKYRKKKILTPAKVTIVPSKNIVREALFSIINYRIVQSTFLDLFSGSGAIGLEALSREAKHVTFVDKDTEAIKVIRQNIFNFKEEDKSTLLHMDYKVALNTFLEEKKAFDFIFLDPPYDFLFYLDIVTFILQNDLLNHNGLLIIESEKQIDFSVVKNIVQKTYHYGKTILYVLRKEKTAEAVLSK